MGTVSCSAHATVGQRFRPLCSLIQLVDDSDPQVARAAGELAHKVSADMLHMPVQQLLEHLLEQRAHLEMLQPEISRLNGIMDSLVAFIREQYAIGPLDIIQEPVHRSSSSPAIMLQDLNESVLHVAASDLLEVKYLSPATPPVHGGLWPVQGALYGLYKRPLVCLPTQLREDMPCVSIIFLVDTAAPITQLSPAAFRALGSGDVPPSAARGIVNGVPCQLRLCAQDGSCSHPDISVLGVDYLHRMGGLLTIDYNLLSVSIHRA